MLNKDKIMSGLALEGSGLGMVFGANVIQRTILNSQDKMSVYEAYISRMSKPVTDFLISEGNDIGGVMALYGLTLFLEGLGTGKNYGRLLRLGVLGWEIFHYEIPQILNRAEGTGTYLDLAIFAIPFVIDLVNVCKSFQEKGMAMVLE